MAPEHPNVSLLTKIHNFPMITVSPLLTEMGMAGLPGPHVIAHDPANRLSLSAELIYELPKRGDLENHIVRDGRTHVLSLSSWSKDQPQEPVVLVELATAMNGGGGAASQAKVMVECDWHHAIAIYGKRGEIIESSANTQIPADIVCLSKCDSLDDVPPLIDIFALFLSITRQALPGSSELVVPQLQPVEQQAPHAPQATSLIGLLAASFIVQK